MKRFILMLALASGLACADDGVTRAEKGGQAAAPRSTAAETPRADPAVAAAAKAEAKEGVQAQPKPRHPDTAGWRRIMAGSGRT